MNAVLMMFTIQCLLGAFDNLWHHELQERLPQKPQARTELALHALRELLYALLFAGIAWWCWQGLWTWVLVAILVVELGVTLADFVVEDRTRRLPPLERVLHTLLAANYGALLALWMPELQRWAAQPTGFASVDYGPWSWALTAFSLGVLAWGLRDVAAVARLGVPQWQREPLRLGHGTAPLTVLVTGATGFIGSALVRELLARGDRVLVLSRDPQRARDRFGPAVEVFATLAAIDAGRAIDAIVNLAGEPVVGGLWTRARKQRLVDSRVGVTTEVVTLIRRLRRKPQVLVSASAIGWYGDRADEALTEASAPQPGFLHELCLRWEDAAWQATRAGVRVCRLRIGLVLGRDGGVLPPMALGTRLAGGTVLGDGRQWMAWIHLQDLLRLIERAIDDEDLHGAVNAVAPQPLRQREFAAALARVLRRPCPWRMPAPLLRAMTGEMARLFLDSARVLPQRALAAGFRFDYAEAEAALAEVLGAGVPAARKRCDGEELPEWGLDAAMLRRRLYVETTDGRVISGFDARLALWLAQPRWRGVARVLGLPGLRTFAGTVYVLLWKPRRAGRGGGAQHRRLRAGLPR